MANDNDRPVDLTGCVVIRQEYFKGLVKRDKEASKLRLELSEMRDMLQESLDSKTAVEVLRRMQELLSDRPIAVGGLVVRHDGMVSYILRDDLKRALTPGEWRKFKKWYALRSGHVDGPYLTDVLEWWEKYGVGRSVVALGGVQ